MTEDVAKLLHRIAARADHVGHVLLLYEDEIAFALSEEGERWILPIDPAKRLYRLTDDARQRQL